MQTREEQEREKAENRYARECMEADELAEKLLEKVRKLYEGKEIKDIFGERWGPGERKFEGRANQLTRDLRMYRSNTRIPGRRYTPPRTPTEVDDDGTIHSLQSTLESLLMKVVKDPRKEAAVMLCELLNAN